MLTIRQAVKGKDLTLINMNWTCLIYGGAMFLALSYYAIDARKWFKGPRINVAHIPDNDLDSGRSHNSDENVLKER